MEIRPATNHDAQQICAIWNPIIRDTLATFTTTQKIPTDIEQTLTERANSDLPYLVAEADGTLLGFATYTQFRAGPGYAHTMEHTINLAPFARRKGVGRLLIQVLETQAKSKDTHSLIAGVSGTNQNAIAFHKACGFTHTATIAQAGFKFGQWLDLVLLQKLL